VSGVDERSESEDGLARGLLLPIQMSNSYRVVIARSAATKQSVSQLAEPWIASAFAKASADRSLRSQW
jgi:hypothetical protein